MRWLKLMVGVTAALCDSLLDYAHGFDASARCSACLAVMDEVVDIATSTQNGMSLDLRRGVGKSKNGKVVPWRYSETRAFEVLDNVCPRMRGYLLVEPNSDGKFEFQRMGEYSEGELIVHKMHIKGRTEIGSPKSNAKGHELEMYCGTLIEQHEEQLLAALTSDPEAAVSHSTSQQPDISKLRQLVCVESNALCTLEDLSAFATKREEREKGLPAPPRRRAGKRKGGKKKKQRRNVHVLHDDL